MRVTCALAAALPLAACVAVGPSLDDVASEARLPARVELDGTPFHPQSDRECGPAAAATVIEAAGRAVTPAQLAREVYLPGREGTLQLELVAAIRARGLVPYQTGATLSDLLAEVAAGRAVLVLQKQGAGPWPAWHYAVLVGYDAAAEEVLLRSGTRPRLALPAEVFMATWARGGRWAIVALEPGELPARADLGRYLAAAARLEATQQHDAARRAYVAAVEQWPESALPRFALANVYAARADWNAAERGYAAALARDPTFAAAANNRAEALGRLGCVTTAKRVLADGEARLAADDPLRAVFARTSATLSSQAGIPEPARCAAYADDT